MTTNHADVHTSTTSRAVIYRMLMTEHICPSGQKALDLLKRRGFEVEDHLLRSCEETDAFKAKHAVQTTPQVWIGGERVGGHDAPRRHLSLAVHDRQALTYKPVIAIPAMAATLALVVAWSMMGGARALLSIHTLQLFLGFATALLALQKLRDVETFSSGFLGYDLLAQKWPRYAYVYPWAEALVGLLMIAGTLIWLMVPIALFIGSIGAVSVFKAVYIDERELKCACVGGNSNVPLGFVSLTENLVMIGMAVWMLLWAM
ncbi:glutaredoxin [Pseudotabrizicola sediminis]|uniref:Methylamine utilization protein MauE n=2 Tax=Pseudotabrizicola sediminis TaxID=2486418 RepID=A0ABY2KLU4_9RHOB|nr:glutaredoxin [Pseudotabrizicola sediminis]